jgi:trimeric autotransporter adhesin
MVGEFSFQDSTGNKETYLDYDATALTYILVNATKELKQENELLKAENTEIKQELAAIKALLIKYIPEAANQQARLGQNVPNPSREVTTIAYEFPLSATSAYIKVYSSTGQEVQSFNLAGRTQGEVTLQANTLAAGTYVYSLFVDGLKIDSKKLVLTH